MGNFKIKINPSSARQHRGIAQGSQRDAARSRCLSFFLSLVSLLPSFFYLISSGLPVEFGLLEHVPEYAERSDSRISFDDEVDMTGCLPSP
ncbi:hypothetical protein VTJ04DRAFT_6169 [Mycothermus thermophilus]|uniref:uncharacterized protein n=1 Tax=Humicola insolens TaxID=85995 RepID=UPI003741F345